MSDLEGSAKRVLLPMMSNLSIPLDVSDRQLIARWVTKTAMVFEFTREQPRSLFYSHEDRAALMATDALPGETVVWLCKYNGSVWPATSSSLLRTESQSPEVIGSVTTMTLKWLAIQLLTIKPTIAGSFTLHMTRGRWQESTTLVCPSESAVVHWPPVLGIGDADEPTVLSLHRRFGTIVRPV
jgi:hypothetical protein